MHTANFSMFTEHTQSAQTVIDGAEKVDSDRGNCRLKQTLLINTIPCICICMCMCVCNRLCNCRLRELNCTFCMSIRDLKFLSQ